MSTVFGMITTAKSERYTPHALKSFFQNTDLEDSEFLLVDNDGDFREELLAEFPQVELVRNEEPRGFAENANLFMERAESDGADLVLLNNDCIFPQGWFPPLCERDDSIIGSVSNAQLQYQTARLKCQMVMQLEEYLGCEEDFQKMMAAHRERYPGGLQFAHMFFFFCVRIPHTVYSKVGRFDQSFGAGGGEDGDYCLRTYLAGFSVRFAAASFVLHFGGKSTWDGAESAKEKEDRYRVYANRFLKKWGKGLLEAFVILNPGFLSQHRGLTHASSREDVVQEIKALAAPGDPG